MKSGDKVFCKKDLIVDIDPVTGFQVLFTKNRTYIIERFQSDDFVVLRDNFKTAFAFDLKKITEEYYFDNFFYTLSELRKEKLNNLF